MQKDQFKIKDFSHEDNQQDESDEFFEANSSVNSSSIDLPLGSNNHSHQKKKLPQENGDDNYKEEQEGDNDGFQVYMNNKHKKRDKTHLEDKNIKDLLDQPKIVSKKKSFTNIRKDSNNSNQSTISIKSNTHIAKEDASAKKASKKSNSSSTFSKIKFRDRSNTKNSNASSNAVYSDSTTNNINANDYNDDELNHNYIPDDTNLSNNNSFVEHNNNGFDTTISDTNNYLLNALEEQDEQQSPMIYQDNEIDEDGNNMLFNPQSKKNATSSTSIQQNQNQKPSTMAKYRSGKFSSTLTNLLPNFSAKLHHSKNKNQIDSSSQPSTPSSDGVKFFTENIEGNNTFKNQIINNQDSNSFNQLNPDTNNKKLQIDTSMFSKNNEDLAYTEPHNASASPKLHVSSDKLFNSGNNGTVSTPKDSSTSTRSKILAIMGSSSSKKQAAQLQKQVENEKKAEKAKKLLVSSKSNSSSTFTKNNNGNEKSVDFISNPYNQQPPIPFPKTNESLLHSVTTNQSGYHQMALQDSQLFLNRTRTDTVSSQITSLSNVPSYPVWNNMPTQDTGSFQYDVSSVMSSNIMQQQQQQQQQQQYNMPQVATAGVNWRPRSKSTVSNSLIQEFSYSHAHSGSYQSLVNTKNSTTKDFQYVENLDMTLAPIMQDDVEPTSFNWITNYPYAPKINYVNNFLQPTNTICVSNIFSIQKTQNLPNFINLTSFALNSLFSQFGDIITIKTLYGLNLALIEFKYVDSAKLAIDAMNGKSISTSIPSDVVFAKIIPLSISLESDTTNKFLLTEQLYNGSMKFLNHGQWTIPMISGYLPAHKEVINQNQTQLPVNSDTSVTHNNSNNHNHNSSGEVVIETDICPFTLPPPNLKNLAHSMDSIFKSFGDGNSSEKDSIKAAFDNVIAIMNNKNLSSDPTDYGPQPTASSPGLLPADGKRKIFDSPTLRDLRKALDNKNISNLEMEQICVCMLDEIAELCSDYLGNTIIQRIFESSSPLLKNLIINNCSQYLTSISVHKNGTWAAQKLITESSDLINNKVSIVEGIKPYCLPLFTDQFGNYVIQCCLKYGPPFNAFIYDNIIKNFWGIVKSRFGSRAVRAVLESSNLEEEYNSSNSNSCKIITKRQLYSITSLIVTYCEYLATNTNGTLLLTWFLDTCTIPNRLEILSKQMVNNIVPLATHKLASLTLIKLLNQRKDDGSSKNILLNNIFGDLDNPLKIGPDSILVNILKDNKGNGTQFILKVLSLSLIDLSFKQKAILKLHEILVSSDPNLKEAIENVKRDKKFIEELGLGTATPVSTSFDDSNANSSNGNNNNNNSSSNSKRNRALSHVFKENNSSLNSDGTHMRNGSVGSGSNASTKNRGYSNSHRMNNGSAGSIWE